MSKLTKLQARGHAEAMRLLSKKVLTVDDVFFVFDHYREDAEHINSVAGAFFTPSGLARDFAVIIPVAYNRITRIIDLCAGIGRLGHAALLDADVCRCELTCVEINPDYVSVGKRLLPEARWVCGDALDPDLLDRLGTFDVAISNPPYGKIASKFKDKYSMGQFEYMLIEAAAKIARHGVFLIPQMSAPFSYSGVQCYTEKKDSRGKAFEKRTGVKLEMNAGFDTSYYHDDWRGVAPRCEIVCCDFESEIKPKQQNQPVSAFVAVTGQLSLFENAG